MLVVSDGVGGFVCIPFFVQSRAGSIVAALFVFTNACMNYRVSSQVNGLFGYRTFFLLSLAKHFFHRANGKFFFSSDVIKPLDSSW